MMNGVKIGFSILLIGVFSGCNNEKTNGVESKAMEEVDFEELRSRMIQEQIESRGIKNQQVLETMSFVPRHEFVPEAYKHFAYDDNPLPIGLGQTISQPYIVALMTELLEPKADDRILEVGTGSGYQSAILSGLVGHVYTIELISELADSAELLLGRLGFSNVSIRQGDGYLGWPEEAPFDGIIVTAGATDLPQPLVDQLVIGGRMVIPIGETLNTQELKIIEKTDRENTKVRDVVPVRFVPLKRSLTGQ